MDTNKDELICGICCNTYNKIKKPISCQYCQYTICKKCIEQYILSKNNNVSCMNCKKEWSQNIIYDMMTLSFINGPYKIHRENILFDIEQSLLPETQIILENEKIMEQKKIERYNKQLELIKNKNELIIQCLNNNYDDIFNARNELINYYHNLANNNLQIDNTINSEINILRSNLEKLERSKTNSINIISNDCSKQIKLIYSSSIYTKNIEKPKERKKFIKPCPTDNCRGFLSSQYNCGLCNVKVCNKCLDILNNLSHECKQENIESAELIKKECKHCPKCGVSIFKIEGCFAKDTAILMWDGSSKMSQNITIGDILVGDDNKPRIVEELVQGEDEMYEVIQNEGMNYTVNSVHTLVLKYSNVIKLRKEDAKQYHEEIELTVNEYIKLLDSTKKNLMGFKCINTTSNNDELLTNITINPIGRGIYYGWKVNDNHRFLLSDTTVVRNCNQMFCTNCNIAFNWRTNEIETGRIHNPHYFDWLFRNGGNQNRINNINQNIGCNGPIHIYDHEFSRILTYIKAKDIYDDINKDILGKITNYFRTLNHINIIVRPRYRINRNHVLDNEKLRKDYLNQYIDLKSFKQSLRLAEKKKIKYEEIYAIYDMFINTGYTLYREYFTRNLTNEQLIELFNMLENLRKYMNENLIKISIIYQCTIMLLTNGIETKDYKFNQKKANNKFDYDIIF